MFSVQAERSKASLNFSSIQVNTSTPPCHPLYQPFPKPEECWKPHSPEWMKTKGVHTNITWVKGTCAPRSENIKAILDAGCIGAGVKNKNTQNSY